MFLCLFIKNRVDILSALPAPLLELTAMHDSSFECETVFIADMAEGAPVTLVFLAEAQSTQRFYQYNKL